MDRIAIQARVRKALASARFARAAKVDFMLLAKLFATLGAVSAVHPSPPLPDVFVDASAPNCGTGTGGLADPVCTINDAIALASPGDTIRIAPGTYIENLSLTFDLDLVGVGGDVVTIVDGGGVGSVITVASATTVTIQGLTLTGGASAQGAGVDSFGDLTVIDSTITGNAATGRGGGIYIEGAQLVITNTTIDANSGNKAGGVYVYDSNLEMVRSTVSTNTATVGGGMYFWYGTGDVIDCAVRDNQAATFGGGVGVSTFGGFPPVGGQIEFTGSVIHGNTAADGAGILIGGCSIGTCGTLLVLSNCTVSGNSATGNGGGLLMGELSSPRLNNVTITANQAAGNGGGIFQSLQFYGSGPRLFDTIVAGNSASLLASADFGGDFASSIAPDHSLIGTRPSTATWMDGANGNQIGTIANPIDPLLGPLQDNGGLTATHALLTGSPALNAADPMTSIATDQRGFPRPGAASADIGAFEAQDVRCNGDGGDQLGCTACPCMNEAPPGTIGGCLNSSGMSTRLLVSGSASVSLPSGSVDDLRFALRGAPAQALCVLQSGSALAPNNAMNPCFGTGAGVQSILLDGLRCAVVATRRHGGRASDVQGEVGDTNAPWGGEGAPPAGLANAGGGFVAGQTRYFQVTHRDDAMQVCMRGLNTSQAIGITFQP